MLYLITGNITERRDYINQLILKGRGDPSRVVRISEEDLRDEITIDELVTTQKGLFGDKEFFVLNNLARTLPLGQLLSHYQSSENIIFFSEDSVTKKITESFEKAEAQIQNFDPQVKEKQKLLPVFTLADHLGNRDKKNLWILYQELIREVPPEELNGIMLWQLKNIAMVLDAGGANPGLKPFVYNKTKKFAQNYSFEEVRNYIISLTTSFHTREVNDPLEVKLERFILSI